MKCYLKYAKLIISTVKFVNTKNSKMKSNSEILITIGNRVREYRKQKGLSQEKLAFDAELHRTYVGMIERAEKNITILNIEKIAKALNVKIIDLVK